jgi:hypothetical protein
MLGVLLFELPLPPQEARGSVAIKITANLIAHVFTIQLHPVSESECTKGHSYELDNQAAPSKSMI